MKMRKKLAAVLAAAMIASVMPMTAFAASTNSVSNTVSIKKDEKLDDTTAPTVKVALKDGLTSGSAFYLNLDGAKWLSDAEVKDAIRINGDPVDYSTDLEVDRSDSTLRVVAHKDFGDDDVFTFRLLTEITGAEATIEIDGAETRVSSMKKEIFATSSNEAATSVKVGDPGSFSEIGGVSTITISEPFTGAYRDKSLEDRTITLELRDSDFEFMMVDTDLANDEKGSRVEGKKGFTGYNANSSAITVSRDKSEVTIVLPQTDDVYANGDYKVTAKGVFDITGLKVRAKRGATKGEVKAVVRGKLVDGSQEIVIAKHADFTSKLEMKKEYEVQTGKTVDVEFKLSEEMANSLLKGRSVDFTLSKGVKFANQSVKVKAAADTTDDYQTETTLKSDAFDDKDNYNSFTLSSIEPKADKKAEYNFKATLLVPSNFEGEEITLTAEGRALTDKHEIVAAKVKKAVTVEVEPMDIKVGLQKQVGGKVVIKETEKESILRNYKDTANYPIKDAAIHIVIGDDNGYTDGLRITDADIKVTEGDIVLDLDEKFVDGGAIVIPVKRQSTKPSTIEITNIEVTANRNVPEGKYNIKVGGEALSKNTRLDEFVNDRSLKDDVFSKREIIRNADDNTITRNTPGYFLDPVVAKEFINITTKNTEDAGTNTGAEVVSFVIGQKKFVADGEEIEMDAAPYIKDGRTMVPLRYLATALGIDGEAIKFNSGIVTIFKEDGKVIQVAVGSKDLVVNGMTIPMEAAAEIIEGRTYVPVTEIGSVFGVSGTWDAATQTATFQ